MIGLSALSASVTLTVLTILLTGALYSRKPGYGFAATANFGFFRTISEMSEKKE